MRSALAVMLGLLIVVTVGILVWLGRQTENFGGAASQATTGEATTTFRIGLIPEREIFQLRHAYRALGDYLQTKLHRPVEIVTASGYEQALQDLAEKRTDAAFLGSFVAVLAMDRLGAQVLVKPEYEGGVSSYRGVFIVAEGSPITRVEQLAGRKIATVRATTAGGLFSIYELTKLRLLDQPNPPQLIWVGTHDDVILEVLDGGVDAGAVKDLRLQAFERGHPDKKIRRLATGEPVPENALLVRKGVAGELGPQLRTIFLEMRKDAAGREALKTFGAARFLPCDPKEYQTVYDMIERIGSRWEQVGVAGPPPKQPSTRPVESK